MRNKYAIWANISDTAKVSKTSIWASCNILPHNLGFAAKAVFTILYNFVTKHWYFVQFSRDAFDLTYSA
jgi:hypothetical protein